MRRGRPSGATPLDRSSGRGAAAPLRFGPFGNYGDTPPTPTLLSASTIETLEKGKAGRVTVINEISSNVSESRAKSVQRTHDSF